MNSPFFSRDPSQLDSATQEVWGVGRSGHCFPGQRLWENFRTEQRVQRGDRERPFIRDARTPAGGAMSTLYLCWTCSFLGLGGPSDRTGARCHPREAFRYGFSSSENHLVSDLQAVQRKSIISSTQAPKASPALSWLDSWRSPTWERKKKVFPRR